MKKMLLGCVLLVSVHAQAQDIGSIIQQAVTRVIRAVDLEIQRLQTQTIFLQEAQKEIENAMSALRLDEIRGWVEQQKDLYAGYFQELADVKEVVSGYHKVEGVIRREEDILAGYRRAVALFGQDPHFSAAEISEMMRVYGAILAESEKNLEAVIGVIGSIAFVMTDQQRLSKIDAAAAAMDRSYRDLQVFTNQNQLISLQRARDKNDYETIKKLYGL